MHLKNTYKLINMKALKFSLFNQLHIFQYMDKAFCVEFQSIPLKFHIDITIHWKILFLQYWKFKSSQIYGLICIFEKPPGILNQRNLDCWKLVEANNKESIRGLHNCHWWEDYTTGQLCRKHFHVITSSWPGTVLWYNCGLVMPHDDKDLGQHWLR